jgi:hypothetical protein
MPIRRLSVSVALLVAAASAAGAQECRPGKDSREAQMLAFFAGPIAFSPSGNIAPLSKGEIRLGFDVTYVPTPSAEIRRPETCYTDTKTENTELSSVFPRPRISFGLGGGLALEATYLPPITVMDATPNLFQVALGYNRALGGGGMSLLLRGHATVGQVKGPITCSPDVIQTTNPTGTCYATSPSEDTYKPNMVGFEGALGFGGNSRLRTYVGAGFTALRPRFHVGFTDFVGNVDTTRVIVDLTRFSAFAGGAWSLTPKLALTAELYSQPEDVTTIRFGGQWVLRKP